MSELCAGTLIGNGTARRAPLAVAASMRATHRRRRPGDHHLPRRIEIDGLDHLTDRSVTLRHLTARRLDVDVLEPEHGGHGALPRRHCRLHGFGAEFDEIDRGS